MNDLFLIIALLLPQLGSPSGPALCWTDIVIKDSTVKSAPNPAMVDSAGDCL